MRWILATDATPTTGNFGLLKVVNIHYLTGHSHKYNEPTKVNLRNNGETDVVVLEDGTINGLEVFPKLKALDIVEKATSISSFLLVPLCESSFTYCIATHPVTKGFTGKELREAYHMILEIAKKIGVDVISLVGDGDSRLRSIQLADHNLFPSNLQWLTTEEFPLQRGLSIYNKSIPMQDCLHLIKKMRNHAKYLSTKLLLLCPSSSIDTSSRFEYAIRWDVIFELYRLHEPFRDAVTTSCVLLTDKQDPSQVTELCFTYEMFYEHNFHGMGLWLEITYLVFVSFYDKSLTPEHRMTNISIVRTVLIIWREACFKNKAVTRHFLSPATYNDIISGTDGMILYLVLCAVEFKNQPIVPWYFTSDGCEQTYSFLRTGRFKGRRTNLSEADALAGLKNCNRSLELDASGLHLLKPTVAHTRGKTLIPRPEETVIYHGYDTSMEKLKQAMRDGVKIGRSLIRKHTQLHVFESVDESDDCSLDSDGEESDSDEDDELSDVELLDLDPETVVTTEGRSYHIGTASEKFLNDGRSRLSAQTRQWRIQRASTEKIDGQKQCFANDGSCIFVKVGDSGSFHTKKNPEKKKKKKPEKDTVRGQVIFLSVSEASAYTSADRSSVSHYPVNSLCFTHTGSYHVWVKTSLSSKVELCTSVREIG